jgi:hypothetical protein
MQRYGQQLLNGNDDTQIVFHKDNSDLMWSHFPRRKGHYVMPDRPICIMLGAEAPVYPHRVQCTDEMDLNKTARLIFDDGYQGLQNSILGTVVSL